MNDLFDQIARRVLDNPRLQFMAIRRNPNTAQLQEWWRNQRGTPEFLAQLEDELLIRAGLKR